MTDLRVTKPEPQTPLVIDDDMIKDLEGYDAPDVPSGAGLLKPRLALMQATSPQVSKSSEKYIRGAEVGDFCLFGGNSAGEVFKNGVVVIPCHFCTHHVHWGKERGGAPIRDYGVDDAILNQCKRVGQNYFLPSTEEVVLEATWSALVTELDDSLPLGEETGWIEAVFIQHHAQWRDANAWGKAIKDEALIEIQGERLWKPTVIFWRAWNLTAGDRKGKKGEWLGAKAERGPTLYEIDPSGGLMDLAKRYANECKTEAMRFKPDPADRARTIEGSLTEPRG